MRSGDFLASKPFLPRTLRIRRTLSMKRMNIDLASFHISGMDIMLKQRLAIRNAMNRRRVRIHDINLLERQSFRFRNAKVGEDEASKAGGSPDEEDFDSKVSVTLTRVDEVGSGVTDTKVPEPIRRKY